MIAIGSDHGGYRLKEIIKEYFKKKSIEYIDYGTDSEESINYSDIAKKVAISIQSEKCEKGILICKTGIGMSITANKFKRIRCALCGNEETAKLSREHNDSNILAIGADFVSEIEVFKMLDIWLSTNFAEGRHKNRIELIADIEKENMI